MKRRTFVLAPLAVATARLGWTQPPAQSPKPPSIQDAIVQKGAADPNDDELEYMCPMDADVRSKTPGKCPRCGMTLVLGMPDPREYIVRVTTTPKILKANEPIELHLRVEDPDTHKPVDKFEIMHEKLYHLFVVSQDMMFFNHVHPQIQPDGSFILAETFPHPGVYRMLSDFYPTGGTPQLIPTPLMVPGPGFKMEIPALKPDLSPKDDANLHVELVTDPPEPLAGFKTMMFFKLTPDKDIEQYIGAWGHMLAASEDLIDMMHTHPFLVSDPDEGNYKQIQFNLIFPRAGIYRVWVQFQRAGQVNTVVYNVPVKNLE